MKLENLAIRLHGQGENKEKRVYEGDMHSVVQLAECPDFYIVYPDIRSTDHFFVDKKDEPDVHKILYSWVFEQPEGCGLIRPQDLNLKETDRELKILLLATKAYQEGYFKLKRHRDNQIHYFKFNKAMQVVDCKRVQGKVEITVKDFADDTISKTNFYKHCPKGSWLISVNGLPTNLALFDPKDYQSFEVSKSPFLHFYD